MVLEGTLVTQGGPSRARPSEPPSDPEALTLDGDAQRLHELEVQLDEAWSCINRPDSPAELVQLATVNYRRLIPLRNRQADRVARDRDNVIRAAHERRSAKAWATKEQEAYDALIAQYRILGPQYEILVRTVAHAFVHLEQLSTSGRTVAIQEWRASIHAVMEAVRTLQQYTESRKVDVLVDVERAAVLKVVQIVQAELAPSHPALFELIVHAIRRDALAAATPGGYAADPRAAADHA